MRTIVLILMREYLSRVQKRSFLIMTFLGPLLIAGLMIVPIWFAMQEGDVKTVRVVDESGLFSQRFKTSGELKFTFLNTDSERAKLEFLKSEDDGLLFIPKIDLQDPKGILYYSQGNSGFETQVTLERMLRSEIRDIKLLNSGLEQSTLDRLHTDLDIQTINLSEEGEQGSNAAVTTGVGFFGAIIIYFFIFLYGAQVMRGVIEEKTSRIVEVIISSVRPFQLMMGKILGIALVGLTQAMLWVILMGLMTMVISSSLGLERFQDDNITTTLTKTADIDQAMEMNQLLGALDSLNVPLLLGGFLFYFIGGYFLYSALFAAIGSAVDSETDTQQFMLPVTVPLILSVVMAQVVIKDPTGSLAFWLSMVPFTSPVIMMVRLPFGVPGWELALSMVCLIAGFLFTTWLAARIYRIGILMYGKKASYKELGKWLTMKV